MSGLLEVDGLQVTFPGERGLARAVDGVSFALDRGRTLAVVGESGCGKSATALAVTGLARWAGARVEGRISLDGLDLAGLTEPQLRAVRGRRVALIPQDPLSALHPLMRVGSQVAEAVRAHARCSRARARRRAVQLLEEAGVPDAADRARAYPHELSGGLRQRAMVAMALAGEPELLVADEPTSALDVTVQAQVLDLLERLQRERGTAMLLLAHDLAVVARSAHEVAVMYAGQIVERAPAERLFAAPEHPYTWGLLGALPRVDAPPGRPLVPIPGAPPSVLAPPPGCRFHPRCPHVRDPHRRVVPPLEPVPDAPEHLVACLLPPPTRRQLAAEEPRA